MACPSELESDTEDVSCQVSPVCYLSPMPNPDADHFPRPEAPAAVSFSLRPSIPRLVSVLRVQKP